MRRAAKSDGNQPKIVRELRKASYGVLDIHQIGKGAPDLVVSNKKYTVLVEIKDIGGRYTKDELKFAAKWPCDIITAFSARDVQAWFSQFSLLSRRDDEE